jgi:hypothetical protein
VARYSWRISLTVAAFSLLALSSCAAPRVDVGQAAAHAAHQNIVSPIVDGIARSAEQQARSTIRSADGALRVSAYPRTTTVPRTISVAAPQVEDYMSVVRPRTYSLIEPYTDDLSMEDARLVLRQACRQQDLRSAIQAQTPGESLETGLGAAHRAFILLRIDRLVGEMNRNSSSSDQRDQLAQFFLCEFAG